MAKSYKCKCGKEFYIRPSWLYKLTVNGKVNYYCSYTCWRADGGGNKKYYVGKSIN